MSTTSEQYRRELDSLQFSDEAMSRMTARLKAAQQGSQQSAEVLPMRRRRPRRLVRVAAALAIVAGVGLGGTTVYGAVTHRSLPAVFSDIFGSQPAQTEVINKIGRPVGATATSNGVTVTADAVIGDKDHLVAVFSIERSDGTPFDLGDAAAKSGDATLPLGWEGTSSFDIDGVTGAGGGAYFYDADPSDPSLQYVATFDNVTTWDGSGIIGRTARVHLEDLVLHGEDYQSSTTVAKGSWDLKFALNYEDSSVDLPAGQKLELNGRSIVVDELSVSPIGASLTYTVDGVNTEPMPPSGRADSLPTDTFTELPFVITFKDGQTENATHGATHLEERDGKSVVTKGIVFGSIGNVNDIASVTIGDQVVPVG